MGPNDLPSVALGFSQADIILTKSGQQFLQRDGATVFLKEVAPGKFNVMVEGQQGLLTLVPCRSAG